MIFYILDTYVMNLSGVWDEWVEANGVFQSTATLTMSTSPGMTNSASDITISVTSTVTAWYDTHIGGTYSFVEIYRNLPVYKVS